MRSDLLTTPRASSRRGFAFLSSTLLRISRIFLRSAQAPLPIKEEFGEGVRKVAMKLFDLVREFNREENTVYIYALVPMLAAY